MDGKSVGPAYSVRGSVGLLVRLGVGVRIPMRIAFSNDARLRQVINTMPLNRMESVKTTQYTYITGTRHKREEFELLHISRLL